MTCQPRSPLPAGLGDIAIAAAAPIIARRPAGRRGRTHALLFWLGILDLVVGRGSRCPARLRPYVAFDVSPTTEPLVLLPLGLIPTGVVPILMALHIVSLRRLRTAGDASGLRPQRSLLNMPSVRERWIDLQAPDEFCEQGVRCRSCRQLPNLEGVSL